MDNLTFDQAVELLRKKVFMGVQDEEYTNAINTIMIMWDEDRVSQLNNAVVSRKMYYIEPDTLYILMQPTEPRYLIVKRAQVEDLEY